MAKSLGLSCCYQRAKTAPKTKKTTASLNVRDSPPCFNVHSDGGFLLHKKLPAHQTFKPYDFQDMNNKGKHRFSSTTSLYSYIDQQAASLKTFQSP
jgi:hypothetical protein